ncbi:AMP binding protein [Abortiporus biennis]|nr:AMP binding protein [Abortiporus biennis]
MKIYTSHIPKQPIPEESVFTNIFSTRFNNFPSTKPAFIDASTGRVLTRGELKDLSFQLGYGLRCQFPSQGGYPLQRGDTIMIFSPNSIGWPIMVFGSIAAGLKVTMANSAYTPRELEHQWKDSGAKVVFVHPSLINTVHELFKLLKLDASEAKKRIIIANWGLDPSLPTGGYTQIGDLLGKGALKEEEKFNGKLARQETAYLCYSSGTTGKPKGVETTHYNLVSIPSIIGPVFPRSADGSDVLIGVLPFYHVYGAVMLIQFPLAIGTPVIIMQKFDPNLFCASIEKYKVTMALVVPPICLALVHHPATTKYNIKSLRILTSAAAPLSPSLVNTTRSKLASVGADVMINQGYGLTETSPSTHYLEPQDSLKKIGSVGRLLANEEARLVNDDVDDAKEGEPGELWIRGPNIMKGYLNNQAATKDSITPDGWFKTGDVAVRDSEGYFFIVDRRKELIKYKGFQVPPAELEAVLIQHPEIVDVAVIGVHSEKDATELPRAYVVHAKGTKGAPADFPKRVQKWTEQRVAKHKFLRGGVAVLDAIPKSEAGKILRRELRERAKKEVIPEIRAKL